MSGAFELAVATLRAASDPVYPVRKALPANKTQHKRALSAEDIGQLLRDMAAFPARHETSTAFRLMWLTLASPSEVIEAQWCEFDLEAGTWRIPVERMQRRKEHPIPLPSQDINLLRTLHGATGGRAHLFSQAGATGPSQWPERPSDTPWGRLAGPGAIPRTPLAPRAART